VKATDVLAASTNVEGAIDAPTAIDEDELAKARLDERWREFCPNVERYVAETTRQRPRVEQPVQPSGESGNHRRGLDAASVRSASQRCAKAETVVPESLLPDLGWH
jgi:hypothetical protein